MEKKETRTEKVMVRFTPSEHEALKKKAAEEGRTASNLIHTIAIAYLNNN